MNEIYVKDEDMRAVDTAKLCWDVFLCNYCGKQQECNIKYGEYNCATLKVLSLETHDKQVRADTAREIIEKLDNEIKGMGIHDGERDAQIMRYNFALYFRNLLFEQYKEGERL